MARPNKPTTLKVLQGTNRPDRANPAEPKPQTLSEGALAPDWLTERGKAAWADILPILRGMNVVTVADPTALAMLCDALAEYVDARAVVGKDGPTYWTRGKVEMIRPRPEVSIASDAFRRAKAMLTEFGLTPASRARVSAKPAADGDPLDKWIAQ